MKYLTAEDVLAIHWLAIQEFGGASEVLNLEQLKSCVETPQQTMFGEDLYPDLESKAAILFFLLIKNHPFVDGNKRTAALSLLEFLERNGLTLETDNDELYQFTLDIAISVLDKDQSTDWIRKHLKDL